MWFDESGFKRNGPTLNRPLGRNRFACVGHYPNQCIPYKGNEHLLGKTDDCIDFYKTW